MVQTARYHLIEWPKLSDPLSAVSLYPPLVLNESLPADKAQSFSTLETCAAPPSPSIFKRRRRLLMIGAPPPPIICRRADDAIFVCLTILLHFFMLSGTVIICSHRTRRTIYRSAVCSRSTGNQSNHTFWFSWTFCYINYWFNANYRESRFPRCLDYRPMGSKNKDYPWLDCRDGKLGCKTCKNTLNTICYKYQIPLYKLTYLHLLIFLNFFYIQQFQK